MTEVETYVKKLEAELEQLRYEAINYVKVEKVYWVGALCLVLGAIAGHFV